MFAAGQQVGGYRLERLLGEGASGVVFAARDGEGSLLALKLLRPDLAPALRARFVREARIARHIESRHLAPILELGESEGVAYLVLPLYERSLAERIPLGVEETAAVAAQVGRALDALHAGGIVHRDVKPSNVLFAADGRAILSDFGLARGASSTRLTREGQLVGTLAYVAPELIEGREASPASDIYALGCVLFECVTGEPPFAGHSLAELGFAHLVKPPPDPRDRRPGLAADVARALLTAMAKEPAERPPTATALARMLHIASRPRSAG